jgi:uncharacterized protein (DUF58 family)
MPGAPDPPSRPPLLSLLRTRRKTTPTTAQPSKRGAGPAQDAERLLQRLDWQIVRRLDGMLQGDYLSLFMGQGLDLADIREYTPGDDVRLIDWNVTARTDLAHVRKYHEDREITAWLLLDASASLDFGTALTRKQDLVVDFAGVMARLLTRRGNRVAALIFSGGVDCIVPPGGGRRQALAILDRLLHPARSVSGAETRLGEVLDIAARTIRRRSLVFVVSDFITATAWEAPLQRLARRHEVVPVWIRDPREQSLPDIGPIVLEDAETGEQLFVDTHARAFRDRFQALAGERQQRLAATFARAGTNPLDLSTDGNLLTELMRCAGRRRQPRGRGHLPAGVTAPRAGVYQ